MLKATRKFLRGRDSRTVLVNDATVGKVSPYKSKLVDCLVQELKNDPNGDHRWLHCKLEARPLTRDPVVALKVLLLLHRIFREVHVPGKIESLYTTVAVLHSSWTEESTNLGGEGSLLATCDPASPPSPRPADAPVGSPMDQKEDAKKFVGSLVKYASLLKMKVTRMRFLSGTLDGSWHWQSYLSRFNFSSLASAPVDIHITAGDVGDPASPTTEILAGRQFLTPICLPVIQMLLDMAPPLCEIAARLSESRTSAFFPLLAAAVREVYEESRCLFRVLLVLQALLVEHLLPEGIRGEKLDSESSERRIVNDIANKAAGIAPPAALRQAFDAVNDQGDDLKTADIVHVVRVPAETRVALERFSLTLPVETAIAALWRMRGPFLKLYRSIRGLAELMTRLGRDFPQILPAFSAPAAAVIGRQRSRSPQRSKSFMRRPSKQNIQAEFPISPPPPAHSLLGHLSSDLADGMPDEDALHSIYRPLPLLLAAAASAQGISSGSVNSSVSTALPNCQLLKADSSLSSQGQMRRGYDTPNTSLAPSVDRPTCLVESVEIDPSGPLPPEFQLDNFEMVQPATIPMERCTQHGAILDVSHGAIAGAASPRLELETYWRGEGQQTKQASLNHEERFTFSPLDSDWNNRRRSDRSALCGAVNERAHTPLHLMKDLVGHLGCQMPESRRPGTTPLSPTARGCQSNASEWTTLPLPPTRQHAHRDLPHPGSAGNRVGEPASCLSQAAPKDPKNFTELLIRRASGTPSFTAEDERPKALSEEHQQQPDHRRRSHQEKTPADGRKARDAGPSNTADRRGEKPGENVRRRRPSSQSGRRSGRSSPHTPRFTNASASPSRTFNPPTAQIARTPRAFRPAACTMQTRSPGPNLIPLPQFPSPLIAPDAGVGRAYRGVPLHRGDGRGGRRGEGRPVAYAAQRPVAFRAQGNPTACPSQRVQEVFREAPGYPSAALLRQSGRSYPQTAYRAAVLPAPMGPSKAASKRTTSAILTTNSAGMSSTQMHMTPPRVNTATVPGMQQLVKNEAFTRVPGMQQRNLSRHKMEAMEMNSDLSQLPEDFRIAWNEIKLIKKIGRGATAEVWKGLWRGTHVAIKRFREDKTSLTRYRKEFFRELSIMVRLRHPNLVLLMGASCSSFTSSMDTADRSVVTDPVAVITEFCEGGSLFALLHGKRSLSQPHIIESPGVKLTWRQKVKLALDITRGCMYLHSSTPQIIHRDLKSLNILLTSRQTLQAKVADFGLSRSAVAELDASSGGLAGTYNWMAPEILRRENYTEKVDIYSFAILLYEIVTQVIPYSGTSSEKMSVADITHRVANENLRPSLAHVPAGCPKKLQELMVRCWDADPARRQGFHEIFEALQQIEAQL